MAKLDVGGNLITAEKPLKALYLQTYTNRMSNDDIEDKHKDIYDLKMELWRVRFENLKRRKTACWTPREVKTAVLSLKNNKSMCPLDYINELLKDATQSQNFLHVLTELINGLKTI